jgi:uncharacterized membrane-anchored protein
MRSVSNLRTAHAQRVIQSTVEGLSVAAITCYIVDLLNDLVTGALAFGSPLSPVTSTAIAIPLVAPGVWGLLRRLHARIRGS